jgi:hypothetical protein
MGGSAPEWKNYSLNRPYEDRVDLIPNDGIPEIDLYGNRVKKDAGTEMPDNKVSETILMLDPALWFSKKVNDIVMNKLGKKIEGEIGYHTISLELFIVSLITIFVLYIIYVLVLGGMRYIKNYPAGKSNDLKKKMKDEDYTLWILEYWFDVGYRNESNFSMLSLVMCLYILFTFYGYYLVGDTRNNIMSSMVMIIVIILMYLVYIMPYNNENSI